MALIEYNILGETRNKVEDAINRLKAFEPPEGYYLAFSGGKDSVALLRIAEMAGVKFDAHYNVTTVDPPEAVRFIRDKHPEVHWERPKKTMRQLIVEKKIPPTRIMRYCCEELKEVHGAGRVIVTGTRWAESVNRKLNQGVVAIFNNRVKHIAEQNKAEYKINRHGGGWFLITTTNRHGERSNNAIGQTKRSLIR